MNFVELAVGYFKQGDYENAKRYYEYAAKKYGMHLFIGNIALCEMRLKGYAYLLNKQSKMNLNFSNKYQSQSHEIEQDLLLNQNDNAKNYLSLKSTELKLRLDHWIDDPENLEIQLTVKYQKEDSIDQNIGIVLFKFFDEKNNELKVLGPTNLSWSEHLKEWYFYLQGGQKNTAKDLICKMIKPLGVRYIQLTIKTWKVEEFEILNLVKCKREPSILEFVRKDYAKILQEIQLVNQINFRAIPNRICYVLNQSLPYQSEGYATRAHGLAKAMIQHGIDVYCLTRPGYPASFVKQDKSEKITNKDLIDGVEYHRFTEPLSWKGTHNYIEKAAAALEKKFLEIKPSCVMAASDYRNAMPALIAAKKLGIPFIYEIRGFWEVTHESKEPKVVQTSNYHLTKYLETEVAQYADFIFTLTGAMKEELVARGINDEKISLLPNSCDPFHFDPQNNPKNLDLLHKLNIPNNTTVIGYIGSFNAYEGLDDLIQACGILHKQKLDFRLLLVGADPNDNGDQGRYASYIKDLSRKNNIEHLLTMPGRITHDMVSQYYSIIDITPFARKPLPVTELVSPLKPLEAMAMGKALVVSSVKALAEMVQDGQTGFVFHKGNVHDLASKLSELIANKAKQNSFSKSAREWVINNRTWALCAKIIQDKALFLENKTRVNQSITSKKGKRASDYKVAFIADEFTYNSFKNEFQAIVIEPDNWLELFNQYKPDIFFCESAWSGVDSQRRPWQGKIYTSKNWKRENRTVLLAVLDYCKKNNIPTVFWNKEDPTHFTDRVHDFIATAKEFDFVFTTAEECCDLYKKEYGVKNVYALPFATNPKLFNPIETVQRSNKVVFAGSWYVNHEQRSFIMEEVLDNLLNAGFKLDIYDRYYGLEQPLHEWPARYKSFIKSGMPHDKMPEVYRSSVYGLNFNTVTESPTMFARRVFELMSCNTLVISNYSKGIENIFGDLVVFADKDPARLMQLTSQEINKIRDQALKLVLEKHTYKNRWQEILTKIGMPWIADESAITLVAKVNSSTQADKAIEYFQGNFASKSSNKLLLLVSETVDPLDVTDIYRSYNRAGITVTSMHHIQNYALDGKFKPIETEYFIYCDRGDFPNPEWIEKAMLHLQYVDEICITPNEKQQYKVLRQLDCQCFLGKTNLFDTYIKKLHDEIDVYTL